MRHRRRVHRADVVGDARPAYGRLYQTPFADRIRQEVGIPTMTVGAVASVDDANTIIMSGRADLVVIARPHLVDPYWTLNAAHRPGLRRACLAQPVPVRTDRQATGAAHVTRPSTARGASGSRSEAVSGAGAAVRTERAQRAFVDEIREVATTVLAPLAARGRAGSGEPAVAGGHGGARSARPAVSRSRRGRRTRPGMPRPSPPGRPRPWTSACCGRPSPRSARRPRPPWHCRDWADTRSCSPAPPSRSPPPAGYRVRAPVSPRTR